MATTANEFGEIRRNLHVTTNWEIAVKEYEAEIARVKQSTLLDEKTKKQVISALKDATKKAEKDHKSTKPDHLRFYLPAFVITDTRNANPDSNQISIAYSRRMGLDRSLGYGTHNPIKTIFSGPILKEGNIFLTSASNAFSFEEGKVSSYYASSVHAKPYSYSIDNLSMANHPLKTYSGEYNFGPDGYIGVSTEAKLKIAMQRIDHVTSATMSELEQLESAINFRWEVGYYGLDHWSETSSIRIETEAGVEECSTDIGSLRGAKGRKENYGRIRQAECEELFSLAMREKIKDHLADKGIKRDLNGPEVMLAFNLFMGIPLEEGRKLSPEEEIIAKQMVKFAKDKENKEARESFVKSLIKAKKGLAEFHKTEEEDANKNVRIKIQKDFDARKRQYPKEIQGLFDNFVKAKTVGEQNQILAQILFAEPDIKRHSAIEEELRAEALRVRSKDEEVKLELGIREVETSFGVIDTVEALGEKVVENLEDEYGIPRGQEEEPKEESEEIDQEAIAVAKREAERDRERAEAKAKIFAGSIAAEQLDKDLIRAGLREGISVEDYLEEKGEEILDVDESLREEEFNYVQTNEIQTASHEQVEENDFETTDEQEMELDA